MDVPFSCPSVQHDSYNCRLHTDLATDRRHFQTAGRRATLIPNSSRFKQHFHSVFVINRLQTHTHTHAHTFAASSWGGQIGHAADTFKLFHGRLSTRRLEIWVNTFHHKYLRLHQVSLKDTYTGLLFSLVIKHRGKYLLGHAKYLFIGLYLPLSS